VSCEGGKSEVFQVVAATEVSVQSPPGHGRPDCEEAEGENMTRLFELFSPS